MLKCLGNRAGHIPAAAVLIVLATCNALRTGIDAIPVTHDSDTAVVDIEFSEPRAFPGEWEFQLFIDSDGNPATGYGHGFEKLVRGVELADTQHVHLRLTAGGGGPGGWGPSVGLVRFRMPDDHHLQLEVPVGGEYRYAFESYHNGVLYDGTDIPSPEVTDGPETDDPPPADGPGSAQSSDVANHGTGPCGAGAWSTLALALAMGCGAKLVGYVSRSTMAGRTVPDGPGIAMSAASVSGVASGLTLITTTPLERAQSASEAAGRTTELVPAASRSYITAHN